MVEAAAAQFPPPQSASEIELMFELARNIPYFSQMSLSEQDLMIRQLQAYECYTQAVTLLKWRQNQGVAREIQKLEDYIAILRIWHDGCEDNNKFIETARECIKDLKLSFSTVRLQIVENIIGAENFEEQCKIYRAVANCFEDVSQKILLLERLAFLFEKKLIIESEVESTYKEILSIQPDNARALRFFKVSQVQNGRWKDAVSTLDTLVQSLPNSFEKQRAAFELAQIHLYQLNQAQKCRDILVAHCLTSRIDISQTYTEALERLGATEELVGYLEQREALAPNAHARSRIKHKIGLVCIKAGNLAGAISNLKDSVDNDPSNLMAHESYISALAEAKLTKQIIEELALLEKNVKLDSSKQTVAGLIEKATALLS